MFEYWTRYNFKMALKNKIVRYYIYTVVLIRVQKNSQL